LVLDIIVLIGAVCNDDACANLLSKSGIIDILIEMLNGKFILKSKVLSNLSTYAIKNSLIANNTKYKRGLFQKLN
jgi:hypothetical protein